MKKALAKELMKKAFTHYETAYPEKLAEARRVDSKLFQNLRLRRFLQEYCWVVYASGFSFYILEKKFPELEIAFKYFDPKALLEMRSVREALTVFKNKRKASNFHAGAKQVIREGFTTYKNRLREGGIETLLELPGIGPITKDHLAKNIGLADIPKADIWLQRAADQCDTTVTHLVDYLADQFGESRHTIDVAIWAFGKDGLLDDLGKGRRGKGSR